MRLWRAFGFVLLVPAFACAHPGQPLQPDDLLSAWEFDPGVLIPLLLSAVLYWQGSRRHFGLTRLERSCFWLGWASLVLALVSPLHRLGEVLFCAHMTQHEILMLVSAPLLVISRPMVTFLWAVPFEWRRAPGTLVETKLCPTKLGLLYRSVLSLVDSRCGDLGLAHPLPF